MFDIAILSDLHLEAKRLPVLSAFNFDGSVPVKRYCEAKQLGIHTCLKHYSTVIGAGTLFIDNKLKSVIFQADLVLTDYAYIGSTHVRRVFKVLYLLQIKSREPYSLPLVEPKELSEVSSVEQVVVLLSHDLLNLGMSRDSVKKLQPSRSKRPSQRPDVHRCSLIVVLNYMVVRIPQTQQRLHIISESFAVSRQLVMSRCRSLHAI